ncbi:Zinc finger MYM-type 3 [Paramuricea clavata]|uniref:Zinc finger MYM-type 3 n=1 Tax=Paramuricea clavata TaxID=317549 RepID=A0A7D9JJF5_PARCT|nr:Zinc finger MYM-type 3 [Paramuricea clavata]
MKKRSWSTVHLAKNNLGGLKHRAVKAKRVEHYANRDRPKRCLACDVVIWQIVLKKPSRKIHSTNHSLRTTTVTRGLEKGAPEKLIMARTGHRDRRSLLTYRIRPDVSTKQAVSKSFECGGPSFVDLTRDGVN